MSTLLMQAQECIPTSKNKPLVKLQAFNGVQPLKTLCSDKFGITKAHYQHSDSLQDMYAAMHKVVKDEITQDFNNSPYKYFGIEIDEATDASNTSIAITFLRYVDQHGTLKTRFLEVFELERTDSECIFDGLETCLQPLLEKATFSGLATDGASVMTGVHRSVATLFKKSIRH